MSYAAIVTGSASGIGEAPSSDLLADGWAVYGIDMSEDALSATSERLANKKFYPMVCDVRSADRVQAVFSEIGERTGKINAPIASAGVIRVGALSDMSVNDFDAIFNVNVRGLWLTARDAIPMLKRALALGELARIVMLSSVSALRPKIEGGAYAASKIAVSQLAGVMGVECAGDGILVNAVAPATTDMPMVRNADTSGNWRSSGPSPLGRIAETQDVVRVIRFLLSEESAYVNGTTIPVDSGTRAAYVPLT